MKDRTSQGIALHVFGSFMLVSLFGFLTVESLSYFSGWSCFSSLLALILALLGINSILAGNVGLLLGSRRSGNLFLTVLAALLLILSPVIVIMGAFIPTTLGVMVIHMGLFSILVSLPLPHLGLGGKWPAVAAIFIGGVFALNLLMYVMIFTVSIYMPLQLGMITVFFLMNGIAAISSYSSYRKKMKNRSLDDSLFPEGMGIMSPKGQSSLGTVQKQMPPPPAPVKRERKDEEVKFPFTEIPGMDPFAFRREARTDVRTPPGKAAPLSSGFKVIATEYDEPEKPREKPKPADKERKSVYYRKPPSVDDLFKDLDIPKDERKDSPGVESGPVGSAEKEVDEARVLADDIDLDLDDVFIDGEDLYEILRIPRFSNLQRIKKAYRKRAMMYHPDLNPGIGPEYEKMIEEEMRKINLAKEILLSADKKYLYDSALKQLE